MELNYPGTNFAKVSYVAHVAKNSNNHWRVQAPGMEVKEGFPTYREAVLAVEEQKEFNERHGVPMALSEGLSRLALVAHLFKGWVQGRGKTWEGVVGQVCVNPPHQHGSVGGVDGGMFRCIQQGGGEADDSSTPGFLPKRRFGRRWSSANHGVWRRPRCWWAREGGNGIPRSCAGQGRTRCLEREGGSESPRSCAGQGRTRPRCLEREGGSGMRRCWQNHAGQGAGRAKYIEEINGVPTRAPNSEFGPTPTSSFSPSPGSVASPAAATPASPAAGTVASPTAVAFTSVPPI